MKAYSALPKRSKYNAKRTHVDNINFDSKLEARYYQTLKMRVTSGEIDENRQLEG